MEKWIELKNGGELFEGADASDFPEAPLGKEIGEYGSADVFIITHVSEDDNYIYITNRFPMEGGDTGLVIRLEKGERREKYKRNTYLAVISCFITILSLKGRR